ncbi:MAG: hypothetical protein JWQ94_1820 [Tardiphaga sp.]|jgi:hypothetical protein|nr:hypothetical protein [Tardiphaga sp.]
MDRRVEQTPPQWRDWINPAAMLLVSWFAIAALTLQVGPSTEIVAVVFPPWWSAAQSFQAAAAADAAILRTSAIPSLLVVRPNDQSGRARLRAAGVWLTIDPRAIAACFTDITKDV